MGHMAGRERWGTLMRGTVLASLLTSACELSKSPMLSPTSEIPKVPALASPTPKDCKELRRKVETSLGESLLLFPCAEELWTGTFTLIFDARRLRELVKERHVIRQTKEGAFKLEVELRPDYEASSLGIEARVGIDGEKGPRDLRGMEISPFDFGIAYAFDVRWIDWRIRSLGIRKLKEPDRVKFISQGSEKGLRPRP